MTVTPLLAASGLGGLFTALGIDIKSLILNTLAFLIIVYVLGRFVYPSLTKALDAKRDELTAAARQEAAARERLEQATKDAQGLVNEARTAADQLVVTARHEAGELVAAGKTAADAQAERILGEARSQLAVDVRAARTALKADTARLVAEATEAVIGEKLDAERDAALIGRSLERGR